MSLGFLFFEDVRHDSNQHVQHGYLGEEEPVAIVHKQNKREKINKDSKG